ncbi:hypothetical protein BHE74_00030425 [Ensete ventricosum]|nr:hypothetical protein BHE74_00030425 [Ensete ventricosum]RZS18563.1 hypothetical protein BHM03_00050857 [Ensete ventricosum]
MPSPPSGMAWKLRFLGFPGLICACLSISVASVIRPVSDSHRSAALELFVPVDGSFRRTHDISHATCPIISEILGSSSKPEDLFHALRVNSILGCQIGTQIFESYITYITGIALETLAGVLSLADSDMDQYKIEVVKNDIVKLFDSIKSYDDGTLYFDEKRIGDTESRGPLATTASVVHGVTAFAAIVSGKLKVSEQNVLKLFLFLLC